MTARCREHSSDLIECGPSGRLNPDRIDLVTIGSRNAMDRNQPDHGIRAPLDAATRAEHGRAVRATIPRASLGAWTPPEGRDPRRILAEQDASRDQALVPLRHERMGASPFSFFRGAAAVFAADMAAMPRTGLDVRLCGDAHLANFGAFASPDRTLVFDLNDFDEVYPGPFEWDLRRLVASFEVAARDREFHEPERATIVTECVLAYATAMREFSRMTHLDVWYQRLTVDDIATRWGANASGKVIRRFERNVEKAKGKDRLRAFSRLVETTEDGPRFRSDPPVLVPVRDLLGPDDFDSFWQIVERGLSAYRDSLAPDRRVLIDRYRFADLARKVVGVGSVGTRCWVALLVGDSDRDPLFLQLKEANASVLEPYLGTAVWEQHGQRVVEGQQLIQSAPDVLLGWERIRGIDGVDRDFYFRQLWDWKGSADLERMSSETMAVYAAICGRTLAQAHARTGDSAAIAAYLGGGRAAVPSLVEFASRYADQTETDHRTFSRPAP